MTALHGNDRLSLHQTKLIIGRRGGRGTTSGTAYWIYETALAAAIVSAIAIRPLALSLSTPDMAALLDEGETAGSITLVLLLATIVLVALGRILGPVLPSAPYLTLVVGSPLSRSATLHGHFARTRWVLVALSGLGAVTLLSGDLLRGAADPWGAVVFLLAVLLGSWQVMTLWLIGQLNARLRSSALLLLAGLAMVAFAFPVVPGADELVSWLGPWGWVAHGRMAVTEGVSSASLISLALLTLGLLGSTQNARLLDRLSHEDLTTGADQWSTIAALMLAGETRAAANRVKAEPRIGRRLRFVFPGRPELAIAVRDLVGLCRFPVRTSLWALAALGGGALLAGQFTEEPGSPLLAAAATLVVYFSLGGWAEGLRIHASTIGVSSPFGIVPSRQTRAHLVVPTLGIGMLVFAGAAVHTLLDRSLDASAALPWAAALTAFLLILQVFSAAAGLLPITLLTPIPTPMGDMSIVLIALWLADAVVIALLVGGSLTMLASTARPVLALVLLAPAGVFMVAWAGIRYRRLRQHNG